MEIKLLRANIGDAEQIHKMQVEAFMDLFNKYHVNSKLYFYKYLIVKPDISINCC